jgi:hypothetical protein
MSTSGVRANKRHPIHHETRREDDEPRGGRHEEVHA